MIDGLLVGHASGDATGCTVVRAPGGAVGAVDVRGGGPGTRETDLLDPRNLVDAVDAVDRPRRWRCASAATPSIAKNACILVLKQLLFLYIC